VNYNRVHGFYIEVSRANSHLVPPDYVRRQTLKNNERYIIQELKEHEDKVLTSQSRALALEKRLYEALFDNIMPQLQALMTSASSIAKLAVMVNFAERADTLNFNAPQLTSDNLIEYDAGRHPVVESVMSAPFIANPLLVSDSAKMLMITGPNMGGKSTYMRQTALIVLLTYIGSYVPVASATIGPIDRIFTRIGASDDLASGRSTFMVEMTETANILNNATSNSLVLMDEIGRGTSTYDGLSLAWACAQYLADQIRCYTLFATHYFELTSLAEQYSHISNVHLSAREHNDDIKFMHQVQQGAASKSYGLQVAKLAGVPSVVLSVAKRKLSQLEQLPQKHFATEPQTEDSKKEADAQSKEEPTSSKPKASEFKEEQLSMELDTEHWLAQKLRSIELDELSPREAQALLYEWRKALK
jgi:DNA mismatch repair protein MutS